MGTFLLQGALDRGTRSLLAFSFFVPKVFQPLFMKLLGINKLMEFPFVEATL